jgi:hypothetical protein
MDRQEEIALALSACPRSVADKTAVYVLEEPGYVKVRESQNGFTAIVQHSQRLAKSHSAWSPCAIIVPVPMHAGADHAPQTSHPAARSNCRKKERTQWHHEQAARTVEAYRRDEARGASLLQKSVRSGYAPVNGL